MGRRHFKPQQIIHMLREAEIKLAGGKTTGEVCRELGISEQSYYRWRKEYGGMQVSQAKKLKDLERENIRLKKLVAEQALPAGGSPCAADADCIGAAGLPGAGSATIDAAPHAGRAR